MSVILFQVNVSCKIEGIFDKSSGRNLTSAMSTSSGNSTPPPTMPTWVGVECDSNKITVDSLCLPGVSLVGPIPLYTRGLLTQLPILSLRSNHLSGPLSSNFSNLTLLTVAMREPN